MKEQILGTGLTGLVGSRVVELNPKYDFLDMPYPKADITRMDSIEPYFINNPDAHTLVHFAAYTDTKSAWEQRFDLNSPCFKVNVKGTENIVSLCQKYHKHLIHISTDYVFNGQKKEFNLESDPVNPLEWYGQTKAMAEKIALDSGATIVRISFPYGQAYPLKDDFIRGYRKKLESGQSLNLFVDQLITPTFIDDIARGLDVFIQKKPSGIYHLVGSSVHSPFEVAKIVSEIFNLDSKLIHESSLYKFLSENPFARPFGKNMALSNQKVKAEFGINMRGLEAGLDLTK